MAATACGCERNALVVLWSEVVLFTFCICDGAKTAAIQVLSRLTFISLDPELIVPLSQDKHA